MIAILITALHFSNLHPICAVTLITPEHLLHKCLRRFKIQLSFIHSGWEVPVVVSSKAKMFAPWIDVIPLVTHFVWYTNIVASLVTHKHPHSIQYLSPNLWDLCHQQYFYLGHPG